MTLGSAIKFWLSIGCFTQEYMENITVALRFFEEDINVKVLLTNHCKIQGHVVHSNLD